VLAAAAEALPEADALSAVARMPPPFDSIIGTAHSLPTTEGKTSAFRPAPDSPGRLRLVSRHCRQRAGITADGPDQCSQPDGMRMRMCLDLVHRRHMIVVPVLPADWPDRWWPSALVCG
jgi:hypothetical protein